MNKIKATKKEMRRNYRILGLGYCEAQHLLVFEAPIAYSCGNNGWECDYYLIDGVIISTGYGPIKSKNMKDDYKLVREYEERAAKLQTREEHAALLKEFIEVMKVKA